MRGAGPVVPQHWNYPKTHNLITMPDFRCILLITISPAYLGWEQISIVKKQTPTECKNKDMGPISEHYHMFGFPCMLSEENLGILPKCIQDLYIVM